MYTAAAEAVPKVGIPRCSGFPSKVVKSVFDFFTLRLFHSFSRAARHFFTIARYTTGHAYPDNLASKDGSQMVVADAAALSLSPLVVALAKPGSLSTRSSAHDSESPACHFPILALLP